MRQYLELVDHILTHGQEKTDPQGIGNVAVCGYNMRFDMNDGFPLLTTKRVSFHNIAGELLWFLRGESHVKWLQERNIHIWDDWATKEACQAYGLETGDLGMIYGPLWRKWPTTDGRVIDQIEGVYRTLMSFPDSRRLIVTSWHPEFEDKVFVAPCHCFFKFFHAQEELSLHLFQRSADVFLGVPYNIASYSLLLLIMAKVTGLIPKEFVHTLSDTHIYKNTIEQCKLQLERQPRSLPQVVLPEISDISVRTISGLEPEDFKCIGYSPHPSIKAEVGI